MQGKQIQGAGLTFLGCGIAFSAIGVSGQSTFIGVGLAFMVLGIVFLAKSRQA